MIPKPKNTTLNQTEKTTAMQLTFSKGERDNKIFFKVNIYFAFIFIYIYLD